LKKRDLKLATAESCTGGWIAQTVTSVSGSSAWFDRGFVTYSDEAKKELLAYVPDSLAARRGEPRDREGNGRRDARAGPSAGPIAVTGVGRTRRRHEGETRRHGVLRLVAKTGRDGERHPHFRGGRERVRLQSVAFALKGLLERLEEAG